MRTAVIATMLILCAVGRADEIVLKNGQKIDGNIRGLKDGQLDVSVFNTYVAGIPTYKPTKVRVSQVRSITFDGDDDFYSIVDKKDDLTFAHIREFSRGRFVLEGKDPVPLSSVKALVPSQPDAKDRQRPR